MRIRALVVFAALVASGPTLRAQSVATPPIIETTGVGEVSVVPDRAHLYITVQTHALTAVQASADNARRSKAVLDALRARGLTPAQLSTANYQVAPQSVYTNGQAPRITGYIVSNEIRAEVPVSDLGSLIDTGLAAGVDASVNFDMYSSQETQAHQQALAKAVEAARSDAEVMARAAGGHLGSLSSLSTSQSDVRPMFSAMAKAPLAAQTPISAGDQSITASVVTRWVFVPNP